MSSESQRFTWDFTSFNVENFPPEKIVAFLRQLATKFVFQLEETQEGKQHYQGRMRLRSKQRLSKLRGILIDGPLEGAHLSITSCAATRDFSYVMKLPRVEGPWSDQTSEERVRPPSDIAFMQKQGLRPWMEEVLSWGRNHKENLSLQRKIYVIMDEKGGAGKSHLKRYGGWFDHWFSIPVMNSAKDLVCFALENEHRVYTIDVPRSMDLKKANEFWTGVERISDADLSDWRYKPRVSQFREKPLIIIFTNREPPQAMMSTDRWVIRYIDHATWTLKDKQ